MQRRLVSILLIVLVLGIAGILNAGSKNPKPGPLTGTWECTTHGGSNGDMHLTLTLEQDKDVVTGSVTSPIGSSELNDATYENKTLELHIESNPDDYILTGKLKGGKLAGEWTHGEEKGAWEGTRQAPTPAK
jgi:hypothetical protein